MFFQPSAFSRQRLPVDQPKVLNLKQHSFQVAQSQARCSRQFQTALRRDSRYLSAIPYVESQEHTTQPEDCSMECSVEEEGEDLLWRCPTGQCRGSLIERELEGLFSYTCSDPTCVIRIEGSKLRWDVGEVCTLLQKMYVQHHFCNAVPKTFLCHGRIAVRCACGLQHDFG
ncbi:MAG: hypothetical protein J0651_03935 [Actinobacteria bacterium]|nr:hypothetical protein [Actinomycetota bacterium]